MFKKVISLLIVFNLVSCSYFKKKGDIDTRKPIAKVNDVFLYKENVKAILPDNYTEKDSVLLVRNYINSWAKKQLLLDKAWININEEREDVEKLVKKYKEDLLINKYREAVVNQNLDTIVSDEDIDRFYSKNKETFKLNEELLRLKFIHLDKKMIDRDEVEKLFKSDKKEDLEELINKELEFKSFYFNDSTWIKFSEVSKEIPLLKKEDLKKIGYITKEDSLDVYLLKINNVLRRNSISPKSYVKSTIKQMILHSRKLLLLKEIERTLLNDANKNRQYEIYE